MRYLQFVVLFGLAALLAHPALAQQKRRNILLSIAPSVGATNYKGDLDDDFALKFTRPGVGLGAHLYVTPHMSIRASFNQGWMGANDSSSTNDARKWRNLHFRSTLQEFSLQLVYDFFASTRSYKFRQKWSPYVYGGVAVYHFNPKAKPHPDWVTAFPDLFTGADDWVELHPLRTEGQGLGIQGYADTQYALTQISIPFGVGIRYKLRDNMNLRVEVGLRKTFTDYLDDVSHLYAPPADLAAYDLRSFLFADRSGYTNFGRLVDNRGVSRLNPDGSINANANSGYRAAQEASEVRGFKAQNDWYVLSLVSLEIILDKKDPCPKFR